MLLLVLVFFAYGALILYLLTAPKTSVPSRPERFEGRISLVVACRNEASNLSDNLPHWLNSLDAMAGSFECILVDDHSTDNSRAIMEGLNSRMPEQFSIYTNEGSGKKDAIATGAAKAKGSWLLFLDADVMLPPSFGKVLPPLLSGAQLMWVFPVRLQSYPSFYGALEQVEWRALQAITAASIYRNRPLMANGACLLVQKKAFETAEERRIDQSASSGDDVFLLHALAAAHGPDAIGYAAGIIAETPGARDWKELLSQRLRWLGKNHLVRSPIYWYAQVTTGMMNLLLAGCALWLLLVPAFWQTVIVIWALKWLFDLCLVGRFQGLKGVPWYAWLLVGIAYPFYMLFLVILAATKRPRWKNRAVNTSASGATT